MDDIPLLNIIEQDFNYNNDISEDDFTSDSDNILEPVLKPKIKIKLELDKPVKNNEVDQFYNQIVTDKMQVFFNQDILPNLIAKMRSADVVFIMAAWFTEPQILAELLHKDFYLLLQYQPELLACNPNFKAHWLSLLKDLNCNYGQNIKIWSKDSLLHHKVIIMARYDMNNNICPYGVWTGSANFTVQSRYNQENCIYIMDEKIAAGYYNNFWALYNSC